MRIRRPHPSHLLAVLLLALLPFFTISALAAQPGEELINSSGALSPGQTFTTPLYSPGTNANFRLHVDGGVAGDTVTMKLLNSGTPVKSWVVQSGETSWGFATLPSSNGTLSLHNDSGKALTYTLAAYARDSTPAIAEGLATWSGTARGNGLQSSIQLNVLTAGRYRFTLNAVGGSFQIKVDTKQVLKTVVPGKAPAVNDSVYYLGAGIHTFMIVQDSAAAQVTWSLTLASLGDLDSLPSGESSQVLGGGAFFAEEWVPLQISAAQPVNLSITATGRITDSLVIELYNGATKVFTSSKVFGGEVAWSSSSLAVGANALHVVAAGNSAALAYSIAITPIARVPFTWSGVTDGDTARANAGHSSIQLTFPTAGLYQFTLAASAGSYQLLLDDHYLQKTVSSGAGAAFTAFVPAGSHKLVVAQNPAAPTTRWSVAVTTTSAAVDTLPFSRAGGTLGGAGNAFREEWLPVRVSAGAPINLRLTAAGAYSDSLRVELYNSGQLAYSAATVYGGEVFWGTAALASGTNLLHIVAAGGNSGQIGYQVDLRSVATIPSTWAGVAQNNGINSVVQLNAPVAGTYVVTLTVTTGAGQVLIDQGAMMALNVAPATSVTVLHVPLSAGPHRFKFQQDAGQPRTAWQIATALRSANQGGGEEGGSSKVYLPLMRR